MLKFNGSTFQMACIGSGLGDGNVNASKSDNLKLSCKYLANSLILLLTLGGYFSILIV